MIERALDEDNIIQVVSTGAATRADIDEHYSSLRELIATLRSRGSPIRVLSDQTRADRLAHADNLYLREQIERTYRPGDRLALLMATNDDKIYARTVLGTTNFAVFESRIAAEMWLMEPSLRPPC